MSSQETLEKHFSQEEIKILSYEKDYNEVLLQIDTIHTNQLLDELEARMLTKVTNISDTLEARWEAFKKSIQEVNIEIDSQISSSSTPITIPIKETPQHIIANAETTVRAKIQQSGIVRGVLGEIAFDWVKDAEASLKDAKGFNRMFGEFSLKIGLGILSMLGFSGLYYEFKKEIADATAEIVDGSGEKNDGATDIKVPEKTANLLKYQAGIELILGLSENDDGNTNIRELLLSKKVQESKFSEIISNNFSLENADGDDIATMKATLISQEGLIDSILRINNQKWRELPLLEIFESIGVYGASFLEIQNITPEKIINGDFSIGTLTFGEGFGSFSSAGSRRGIFCLL